MKNLLIIFTLLIFTNSLGAKDIVTNEVRMFNAPKWLKQNRFEKITKRIQRDLEWSTRRVNIYWYSSQREFSKAQNLGSQVNAVTKLSKGKQTVHLGPKVTDKNFDRVFAHELVHVVIDQKYKGAIPRWFEEGLANHLAKANKVNYNWLSKQEPVDDVRELSHPFKGSSQRVSYRYKASQALAEMLDKKCNLMQLIQLSVKRKMEDYIKTYCEIKDINIAFKEWVTSKSGKKVIKELKK